MNLEVLSVADGIGADFERAWTTRLSRTPHANFTFSIDYLRHEAACGANARLVLVDDRSLHGAMILREEGREWVCGYPWRTQAVVEDADPARPEGMSTGDAERLFEAAGRIAGRHRLRFHVPYAGPGSHPAGRTVLVDLARRTEEELFARLDRDKRAWIRRAGRRGVRVCDRVSVERLRAFATILDDVNVRRHRRAAAPPCETPPPGEDWRTWERPWHSVLFATFEGRIIAGLGWGRYPGAMLDGRANGATDEGRRRGASILLLWEVLRRSRAEGLAWANFGGDTPFKREFGGTVMHLHARLGGGVEWLAPNLIENLVRGEGRRVAKAVLGRFVPTHEHAGQAPVGPAPGGS